MSYADIERIKGANLVRAAQIHADALRDVAETASTGGLQVARTNADASMWNSDVHSNALRDVANTGAGATKFAATEGKEGHIGAAAVTGKYGVKKAQVEEASKAPFYQALARAQNLTSDAAEAAAGQSAYHNGAMGVLGVADKDTLQKNPDLLNLYNTYKATGDLNALTKAHDNYQWHQAHAPNVDSVIQYAADKGYPIAPGVQNQIRAGIASQSPDIRATYGPLFEDYAKNNPASPMSNPKNSTALKVLAAPAAGLNQLFTGGTGGPVAPAGTPAPDLSSVANDSSY